MELNGGLGVSVNHGRKRTGYRKGATELFFDFPMERFGRGFVCLNLAAREFPLPAEVLVGGRRAMRTLPSFSIRAQQTGMGDFNFGLRNLEGGFSNPDGRRSFLLAWIWGRWSGC